MSSDQVWNILVWVSEDEAVEGLAYLEAVARNDQAAIAAFTGRDPGERPLPALVAGTARRITSTALISTAEQHMRTVSQAQNLLQHLVRTTPEGRLLPLAWAAWNGWAADSVHPAQDAWRIAESVLQACSALLPDNPLDSLLREVRQFLLTTDGSADHPVTPIPPPDTGQSFYPYEDWTPPAARPDPADLVLGLHVVQAHLDDPSDRVGEARWRLLDREHDGGHRVPLSWLVAEAGAWVITHTTHHHGHPALADGPAPRDSHDPYDRLRHVLADVLRTWGSTATPYNPAALAETLICYLLPTTGRPDRQAITRAITTVLDDARAELAPPGSPA